MGSSEETPSGSGRAKMLLAVTVCLATYLTADGCVSGLNHVPVLKVSLPRCRCRPLLAVLALRSLA